MSSLPREENRIPALGVTSTISNSVVPLKASPVDFRLLVDAAISSSSLPTGAATEATLSTINSKLVSGTDIGDVTINNAAGASAVNIQDGGNSITVDGSIAATQSGTWNITNISGTVSLPTGAATSALQTTGNNSLSSIDTKTPALGQALAAGSVPVVLTAAQLSTLTPLSTVAVTQSTTPWATSLAAETTKVIGVVRNADGSGNLLTSTTNALDINIKSGSIANTAFGADLRVASAAVTTSNPVPIMPPLVGYLATLETALASVGSFLTSVTTAGTRVQLATNTCKSLTIKARATNTGLIYVGTSTVASTNGFQLLAGESVSLDISNTNLVYIDSSVNGEGITTIFAN